MAAHSSGTGPAGNPVPAPPADPSGRAAREGLAGLDDRALAVLVQSLPRGSQRRMAACELLVSRYEGLVRSCVRPYVRSPVPAQDLMQVGYLGLLTAISHFDPAVGASLAAYARPCVSGELKRPLVHRFWRGAGPAAYGRGVAAGWLRRRSG
jgi:RNA polymerase sigma-B factor